MATERNELGAHFAWARVKRCLDAMYPTDSASTKCWQHWRAGKKSIWSERVDQTLRQLLTSTRSAITYAVCIQPTIRQLTASASAIFTRPRWTSTTCPDVVLVEGTRKSGVANAQAKAVSRQSAITVCWATRTVSSRCHSSRHVSLRDHERRAGLLLTSDRPLSTWHHMSLVYAMGFSRVLSAFRFSTTNLVRVGKRFEARSAAVDQFQWSYLIRPAADPTSREVVVFLHGLGSSKEAWVRVSSGLSSDYHVVIPDLPGHGKTTPLDPLVNFAADRQTRRLHEFFESELYPNNKVHLVGTCIGATVAGLYAAMHPTRVKSLALMCPWGIAVPTATSATLSDMELLDKLTLQSPTATSASEVGEWRDSTVNVKHMLRALRALTTYKRGREWQVLQKVGMDTLAHPSILEDSLGSIRARTIVVWGKEDAVLDAACLEVIDDKLNVPRKHVLALDDCGHLITSDKPSECIDLLNRFLGNLQLSCSPALAEQASAMAFEPPLPSQD